MTTSNRWNALAVHVLLRATLVVAASCRPCNADDEGPIGLNHSHSSELVVMVRTEYAKRNSNWTPEFDAVVSVVRTKVFPLVNDMARRKEYSIPGGFRLLSDEDVKVTHVDEDGILRVTVAFRPLRSDSTVRLRDFSTELHERVRAAIIDWASETEAEWLQSTGAAGIEIQSVTTTGDTDSAIRKLAIAFRRKNHAAPRTNETHKFVEAAGDTMSFSGDTNEVYQLVLLCKLRHLPKEGTVWRRLDMTRVADNCVFALKIRLETPGKQATVLRTSSTREDLKSGLDEAGRGQSFNNE